MARRLAACCLLLFALAGNALAQGQDKQFVIKKTKYNPAPGEEDHYLAHVYNTTTNAWELQDATEFGPNCLWYSGREYNLMGTNHNYYFIDDENHVRFLMAPMASGGTLSLSSEMPPVYLLNNTDHNYYFYDWDYDNRPNGGGVARGHQYNGITGPLECQACAGGQWHEDNEECWAVYWVECNGTTWSLSTVSQYNITENSGRFRGVTVTPYPLVVVSPANGGLADLGSFAMEYPNSQTLSATITPFRYIPAYNKYDFDEVTVPAVPANSEANPPVDYVPPTITHHTYYYPYGSTNTEAPTSDQAVQSGSESQWTYSWSVSGEGADYLSFSNEGTDMVHSSTSATPTLYYRIENNDGHKTATLTLTVTYQDGSTQSKSATVTVLTPCQNPQFSASVNYEGVTISWTPTAESYIVSWKKVGTDEWSTYEAGNVTSHTIPISELEYHTTYDYKVKATCDDAPQTSSQFTTLNQPTAVIGGAVFGGGRMANVGGKTEVIIINTDSIAAVYGGNDIAGEVLGADGSTIILGVSDNSTYSTTYNNGSASTKVRVGDVYGGGNGYYAYNGTSFEPATNSTATVEAGVSLTTLSPDGEWSVPVWTNEGTASADLTIPTIVKTSITVNTNVVKVDSIFGGAKNAFITNDDADANGTSITVNGGTAFAVFGGNNYGGNQTAGKHHIEVNNTKNQTSGYPDGLGRNYGIGYVFGGGNKVEGLTTDITISGGMCDTVFAGGNAADVNEAKVQINCAIGSGSGALYGNIFSNAIQSYNDNTLVVKQTGYDWNGTGIYNVRALFGGNNRADMSGLPTITLTSGSVGTVYGGGNAGKMLAQIPDDEDPEQDPGTGRLASDFEPLLVDMDEDGTPDPQPIYYSTHVIVDEPTMLVDYLYGGCQMSDVKYSTWVEVENGHVGTVYGGCNISGDVGSEPRLEYYSDMPGDKYQLVKGGTYVKASGGTIYKNLFAGSNGYYHCNDGIFYIDGVINLGHYIGDTIPTHNDTRVMVSDDVTVKGNVYAGGNLAYVGFINETDQSYRFRDFVGFCSVKMDGGVVEGSVYGGGNRASVFGSNAVQVSGGSIGYIDGVLNEGAALYGGNDRAGQVAQITNRVLPDSYSVASDEHTNLKTIGVKTYVGITGKPRINTVYGGGNGAYTYTENEYCDVTDQPVQSNTFVDVNINASGGDGVGGYINTVYGGGNGVTVLDRITVFVNVEEMPTGESAYDQVGTIFGGNNKGDLDILSDIIMLNGQVNTIYGGCNEGAMQGSHSYTIDGTTYDNLGSLVYLRSSYPGLNGDVTPDAKVTGYVYGGCRSNGVTHNTLVLVEGGNHPATFFGGSDISGNVGDTTRVVVKGGTVGTVYGGGNGNYYYSGNNVYDANDHDLLVASALHPILPPYCDSTSVEMLGGRCTGSVFAGGYAGECGDTYLQVDGCTVDGGLYGGGNRAGVTIGAADFASGSTSILMTSGSIGTGVYGGCNATGEVAGNVNIEITGGTVGTNDTHTADIYGGGYGQPTTVGGNIDIKFGEVAYEGSDEETHEIHTEGPILFGDLYGGSAFGNVNTDDENNHTNIITHTTIHINNGTLHGNVYGGGLGYKDEEDSSNDVEAKVFGKVYVYVGDKDNEDNYFGKASFLGRPIDGGTNYGSSIFGCNNLNGSPQDYVHVYVYQTNHTVKDICTYTADDREYAIFQVFGGGNKANYAPDGGIATSTKETEVHIFGCENTIEWVFGGSNAAHSNSTNTIVDGGRFQNIFGGGNGIYGEANVGTDEDLHHTYSTIKGGRVGWCFGGSNRLGNCINPVQTIYTTSGACGPVIIDNLFQGGNQADQYGEMILNLSCAAQETYLAAYGGCRLGNVYGDIIVNVTGGTIGSLYGGCQGDVNWAANVMQCPTQQEVTDHGDDYPRELKDFLVANPHWYGRGGNITIVVKGGAIGNLFGGCEVNGNVQGTITIVVEEDENECDLFIGNVYGASDHTPYEPNDPNIISPRVNIIKGTIGGDHDFNNDNEIQDNERYAGNVFGGGNLGYVTSNPRVNIGDGSLTKAVNILGSVYGGGNEGDVNGSAQVFVVPSTNDLTVNPPHINTGGTGGGTVTVGTQTCSTSSTTTIPVGEGVDISITATPATATVDGGYLFNSWTVSGTGASVGNEFLSNTIFSMGTANATLTANFTSVPAHKLFLVADPSNGGTFHITINGTVYTTGTEFWIAQGATVTVEAIPATGYVFKKWELDGDASISSTEVSITNFTMGTNNATLTATFVIPARRNNTNNQ